MSKGRIAGGLAPEAVTKDAIVRQVTNVE
jgi:hypothetical protein